MKTQLIIDGNSILNRSFFGVRTLTSADGFPTNALFGMANTLIGVLEEYKPDYAVVAYDLPVPTFRHNSYSEYKAGRKKMPEELALQLPVSKELCSYLGFNVITLEGYEADDLLGTYSALADGETFTYLLTGDKDSFQLINDKTTVIYAGQKGQEIYDVAHFTERYGVSPSQFVDVKALMGDSSDNIPGVYKIGEKTALSLILQKGSLDAVYADVDSCDVGAAAKAHLKEDKEKAYLSQYLAKIITNAPVEITDVAYRGIDKDNLYRLLERYGLKRIITHLKLTKPSEKKAETEQPAAKAESTVLENADGLKAVLGDSVAFSFDEQGGKFYCGEKLYIIRDIYAVKDILEGDYSFVVYDLKTLRKKLLEFEIDFGNIGQYGKLSDVMLEAYLIDSNSGKYTVDELTAVYTEAKGADVCISVYKLHKLFIPLLAEAKQERLACELEAPLACVLCDMENAGFAVDRERLREYGIKLEAQARELEKKIYSAAGYEFNINSPKQLGEALFEKMELPVVKKTKSGYSTAAEVLEKLKPYSPVINDILLYRQTVKFKSTYADALYNAADEDGRVHTTFRQTAASTGRLSSTEPNLQNIPVRTESGREFRKCFVAKSENYRLVDADYSQIELRILAAVSGDDNMISAFNSGEDIHRATAAQVFGVKKEEVTDELRKRAKAVNFGIVYGISDFSLAQDIGVSRRDAGKYIESYLGRYPKIDQFLSSSKRFARENGYVSTLFGRRRYIPELKSTKYIEREFGERVAMNSPIQGTAADIIKLAMVNIHKRLIKEKLDAKLILQVHDELIIECNAAEVDTVSALLKEEMENAVSLAVTLTADVTVGSNWGE